MRCEVVTGLLAAWVAAGCGRLKSDAPDAGEMDAHGAAPSDAAPVADVDPGRALPAGISAPARFFAAPALLAGNGPTACTHQTPPSSDGHRWCGVIVGADASGIGALWVVDVTRAAEGDVPVCDGTNAGCLRLTDELDTRAAAFFDGDTLIYGTDPVSGPGQDFVGRLFAWRPGWTMGRQISSDAGVTCLGNTHSAAAACLDDPIPIGDPTKRDSVNVSAGYLLQQTGGALPSFGRWPLRNDDNTAWQADFSPDGSIFVLTDADTIGATRTLRLALTVDVGQVTPAITLEDVTYWQISNDEKKIYFIRGLPQRSDLYVADFPTGGNATLLDTAVHENDLIGDEATDQDVKIEKSTGHDSGIVELLRDRASAPEVIFAYTGVLNGWVVSPDLRYTTWLDDSFHGTVFRNADLARCALDSGGASSAEYDPVYLASASLMFWQQPTTPGASLRDAFYAPPERCHSVQKLASHVDLVQPIGDRGVVFDDGVDVQAARATLKYIAASADGTALDPQGAVRVQGGVTEPVVFVGEDPPLLVYSAKGATPDASGLYVFGPVPF